MTDIKHLKEKYILDLDGFELAKQNFYAYCNKIDNPGYSIEKSKEAFEGLCKKFDQIFRICSTEASVSETADIYFSEQKKVIPAASFYTHTTKFAFTMGLFRDFYLTTELKNPHNLKLMKDDFWHLLFKLADTGKFQFKENEKPTSNMRAKYPQLFNKQGNYYKLLRNLFLYEVEYGLIRSLGYISVSWNNKTPFKKLIVSYCEAFRIMYQLNLLLWRQDNKILKL